MKKTKNPSLSEDAVTRAQKACLNCRARKIACDRSLPACKTCKRRRHVCSGYFESLSWPREGDRRRACTADVRNHPPTGAAGGFINTSSSDIGLYYGHARPGSREIATNLGPWLTPTPGRSLLKTRQFGTGLPPDQYSSAIRMVTARGDLRQDVCSLLYRMSLTDDTPPSLAVRHSMNAISYLHLQRPPEALYHHTRAVSALQHAIGQIPDPRAKSQAIAASMLLSLFEALDKSGTIGNWSIYFDGCLMIINSNCQKHQTFEGDEATLLDWVFYHSVMYKFSVTHWLQRTRQQEAIIKREMVVSNPIFSPQRHIIHSTLGCSLELLDLLGQIFDLVRNRQATEFPSKEYECTIACLDRRLRAIDQRLCSGIDNEEFHVVGSRKHYTLTARLFQLSGLIYLDRVARGSPITSTFSRAAAEEAFGILKDTGICERPFPLFILSIQSESDKNRLLMLDVLERTRKERPLSNLAVTEQLMCKAWAQKDLHGGEDMDALFLLNTIFSANDSPPSLV